MGSSMSSALKAVLGRKELKTLMLGLDAAGKTTILYGLRAGEVQTSIPTIGFNVESLEYRRGSRVVSFTSFDIGGRSKIRPLARHYYSEINAIVFVVDSNDRDRLEDVADEFQKLLGEEDLRGMPFLVFANKQDLPGAMSPIELAERLKLNAIRGRPWMILPCCATKGEGVVEGFDWLTQQLEGAPPETRAPAGVAVREVKGRPVGQQSSPRKPASEADTESTVDPGEEAPLVLETPAA